MTDTATAKPSADTSHDTPLTPWNLLRTQDSPSPSSEHLFSLKTRVAKDEDPWVAVIVIVTVLTIVWLLRLKDNKHLWSVFPQLTPILPKTATPFTYNNASLAFKGNSLDRYLMCRQFMVLLVVFVIKRCTSPVLDFLILSS